VTSYPSAYPAPLTGRACPACRKEVVIRTNRSTLKDFLGCSGYPLCRWTSSPHLNYSFLSHSLDEELEALEWLPGHLTNGPRPRAPAPPPPSPSVNMGPRLFKLHCNYCRSSFESEDPCATLCVTCNSPASKWVRDLLRRNEGLVDGYIRTVAILIGNAIREGRGGFNGPLIEKEVSRMLEVARLHGLPDEED
jgi:ssDNA-binding Zn-finger/Zn-ribbon topoisomerase 1